MPLLNEQRRELHQSLLKDTLLLVEKKVGEETFKVATNADSNNKASRIIAKAILEKISPKAKLAGKCPKGQTLGDRFEKHICRFLEQTFKQLHHLRPGPWDVNHIPSKSPEALTRFEQYRHLSDLQELIEENPKIKSMLGSGHLISPDVIISRRPLREEEINSSGSILGSNVCNLAPLRLANQDCPLLHANISCKFTMRSDRAQNSRTEALNLIRNRKGHTPHIIVVTAEPQPSRLASLALGTGDIDCVYHFALPELRGAVASLGESEAASLVELMVEGKRLRDISDLPLDLAI